MAKEAPTAHAGAGSLAEILAARAARQFDTTAYIFLPPDFQALPDTALPRVTYGELDGWAWDVAAALRQRCAPRDRVLLLNRPGLDFLAGFFGCLYAGMLPVPLRPPESRSRSDHICAVVADCQPALALATDTSGFGDVDPVIQETLADGPAVLATPWLVGRTAHASSTVPQPADIACLQYTSGSTGNPKGVMVTQQSLLATLEALDCGWEHDSGSVMVSWLPAFHDMGLIYGLLQPLYNGFPCYFMAPRTFLLRPVRWLQAISRWRGTHTAAPNFAFEYCLRTIRDEDTAQLDLSSLQVALCAAEPIRRETLEGFAERFAHCGFQATAFAPGYGLAEASLKVTAQHKAQPLAVMWLDREALVRGHVVAQSPGSNAMPVVGCGAPAGDTTAVVVEPGTAVSCPPDVIGEIWVAGTTVAAGYWNRPEETAATFAACRAGYNGTAYLRTGDMGFFSGGALYVTGRLKDLIIIRGANYYPQDIEHLAGQAHPAIRPGRGCAVAVERDGREQVVVLHEVVPRVFASAGAAAVVAAIRSAVLDGLGLALHAVVLLRPSSLPWTTSGKLRRFACRDYVLAGCPGALAVDIASQDDSLAVDALMEQLDSLACGLDSFSAARFIAAVREGLGLMLCFEDLLDLDAVRRRLMARLGSGPAPVASATPAASRDEGTPFPLTPLQQAFWLGRAPGVELGGIEPQVYMELDWPAVSTRRLRAAWDRLVARHGILRSVVRADGTQQVLPEAARRPLRIVDVTAAPAAGLAAIRAAMAHRAASDDANVPWELCISRTTVEHWRVHLCLSLLVVDFRSLLILLNELDRLHDEPEAALPPPGPAFHNLLSSAAVETERLRRARAYWLDRLDALPPAPELPLARSPESIERPTFRHEQRCLAADDWRRLRQAVVARGLTASTACLAAFAEVLRAWSRTPEFMVNITTTLRPPEADAVVGVFTNPILLAIADLLGDSFVRRAQQLQRQLWRDLDHWEFGGVEVLRALARREGRRPRARMPVVFTSLLGEGLHIPHTAMVDRIAYSSTQTPQVWLHLRIMERAGQLVLELDAVDSLFPGGLVEDMLGALAGLLTRLARDAGAWEEVAYRLLPSHQAAQRAAVNATAVSFTAALLHDGFERQARTAPERPAVLWEGGARTYGDLQIAARDVATRLRALGVGRNQLVAIMVEKGWQQVVAVLAVSMSGAAYLPVDPGWPRLRRDGILEAAGVRLAVVAFDHCIELPPAVLAVSVAPGAAPERAASYAAGESQPSDLAYVIFTSGSTGTPKGVMIDHRAALNTIDDINRRLSIGPQDRVLALSSLAFDLSVYDIFGILSAGGAIVMPGPADGADPHAWLELTRRFGVTIWNSVPALAQLFVDVVREAGGGDRLPLRTALLSGDVIPPNLPQHLREIVGFDEIMALGGATEAAIWSVYHRIQQNEPGWATVPYGRPLANQTCHVLDQRLLPRPDWVAGELYIGGLGVALGYWADPATTQAHFIIHPETGERLYRTGDIARYRPCGTLEFLGRADGQVKVNGLRIELGDIESVALQAPHVIQATAVIQGDAAHGRRIVLHAAGGATLSANDLHVFLAARLPGYMVPARILIAERVPLTPNGKIDRQRLAALPHDDSVSSRRVPAVAPGASAAVIAAVEEVLQCRGVLDGDNLFERGATSLDIIRIRNRLAATTGVSLSIADLFACTQVADLARLVDRGSSSRLDPARGQHDAVRAQAFYAARRQQEKRS